MRKVLPYVTAGLVAACSPFAFAQTRDSDQARDSAQTGNRSAAPTHSTKDTDERREDRRAERQNERVREQGKDSNAARVEERTPQRDSAQGSSGSGSSGTGGGGSGGSRSGGSGNR
jgi:uncharacterized membrane protein YgcG